MPLDIVPQDAARRHMLELSEALCRNLGGDRT